MSISFLHLGDPHLGYQQYGSRDRFNDFIRSFSRTADYAIKRQIKALLIPGDLFHPKAIDPVSHAQAGLILERLREAGVRVIVIEGNHDSARYKDVSSWISNLNTLKYITQLDIAYGEDGIAINPWDEKTRAGAYVDVEGLRVYGIQHVGASTEKVLKDFAERLADPHDMGVEFSVLCMHAGMEGVIPGISGGLSPDIFAPLKGKIDYIALGHIHKKYEIDGWIFNPGSLEPCSMEEAGWRGGFYRVAFDGDTKELDIGHVSVRKRPFLRIELPVDTLESPGAVYEKLDEILAASAPEGTAIGEQRPVVEVAAKGAILFQRSDLDLRTVEAMVTEKLNPIAISDIRNEAIPVALADSADFEERQGKAEIETGVFLKIAEQDSRYAPNAAKWAELMSSVKRMALEKQTPEQIIAALDFDSLDQDASSDFEAPGR